MVTESSRNGDWECQISEVDGGPTRMNTRPSVRYYLQKAEKEEEKQRAELT